MIQKSLLVRCAIRCLALVAWPGCAALPAPAAWCSGDCDGSGAVTIDEVLRTLGVALDGGDVGACPAAERNADGVVSVDEVVFALQMALQGCPERSFVHGMNLASWWHGQLAAPAAQAALDHLAATTFASVVVVPTYYMHDSASSEVFAHPLKTSTADELAVVLDEARARGFRTALKPHVDPLDGRWRGRIAPADVDAWFASYTEHVVALAQLANRHGCDLFVVASELQSLIGDEHRERWRGVIAAVREVYGGAIAYAANWDGYDRVAFWDLVDDVGVQAYFPLSPQADPSEEELIDAWAGDDGWLVELLRWYGTTFPAGSKRLLFTEVGYVASDHATRRPWEMEADCPAASGRRPYNGALQARAYAALLRVAAPLDGLFWWHWEPFPVLDGTGRCRFTPQGKPAEAVLQAP